MDCLKSILESGLVSFNDGQSTHDGFSIIFDGFPAKNDRLQFYQLKTTLDEIKNSLFDGLCCGWRKLFAFRFKTWDRQFYEVFLSCIYANNPFFVIDPDWPDDYVELLIEKIQPNYAFIQLERDVEKDLTWKKNYRHVELTSSLDHLELLENKSQLTPVEDLAYVISTSGTTGSPKIINVCNSSIVPNIKHLSEMFKLTKCDRIYQASSLTFDPSMIELFCALYSKSTLVVFPRILRLIPAKLAEFFRKHDITTLQITPSLYKNMKNEILTLKSLRRLILGGEQFPNDARMEKLIQSGVEVYNIYGISEMSCWSSCHLVSLEDLTNPNGVPIGRELAETKFYIKTESKLVDVADCILKNGIAEGCLLHFSETRKCYVNFASDQMVDGGDLALLAGDGKIYIKGRLNRSAKINGKLLNLNLIDNTINEIQTVDGCHSILYDENTLVTFIFVNKKLDASSDESLKGEVYDYIRKKLPSHYEPAKMLIIHSDNVPLTNHGKLNEKKLIDILVQKNIPTEFKISDSETNPVEALRNLWKNILQVEYVKDEDNFIFAGGNSLKAVRLAEDIEHYLQISASVSLDTLLNATFFDLVQLVVTFDNDEYSKSSPSEPTMKRTKFHVEPDIVSTTNESIICWFSKCFKYYNGRRRTHRTEIDFERMNLIETMWKVDMVKCVDASPLLLAKANSSSGVDVNIFIGSHSSQFICVDGCTGSTVWKFCANDRIESSACLSRCGNLVIFGSYDHNLYILNVNNGELYWKYEANDVVKSSPCVDFETGFVYFGSHDKKIYCLDIEKKELKWERNLNNGSIFAGPTCDSTGLYVSTLGGCLFSMDKRTGDVKWKFDLDKPSFTTPILDDQNSHLYTGTCGGRFICLSTSGEKKWEYEVSQPIFSNACVADEFVLFGCHDGYLYCLNRMHGTFVWNLKFSAEMYSTPFRVDAQPYVIAISCDSQLKLIHLDGRVIMSAQLFQTPGNMCYSSPIVFDDRFFVGSRDNFLNSFKISHKNVS